MEPTAGGHDDVGVLIVDDHRVFAESLAHLLAAEAGIDVLGVAYDGDQALARAAELAPRIMLLDYSMPGQDGVAVTRRVKAWSPDTKVIMLTGSADHRILMQAMDAGCSGFLTKDRAAADVADAVRRVAAGESLISPTMLSHLLPELERNAQDPGHDLTGREREILQFLARGATNRTIASQLALSVNTVRNHVQSILTKLESHSKLEAVWTAVDIGLIDYPNERRPDVRGRAVRPAT